MGLRGQLTVLISGLVALSIAAFSVAELREERREALIVFRQRSEKTMQAIGVTVAMMVAQNDVGALDTLVAQLSQALELRELSELVVVDDEGRVLAHSEPQRFNTILTDDFTRGAIDAEQSTWLFSKDELLMSVPAMAGIRWATVTARYDLSRVDTQLRAAQRRFAGAVLLLFAGLAITLFLGLDRLVVRPLRTLQQAVRRMGEGTLSVRVPPLKGRELAELADNVNRMAAGLQHERENLERIVADRTRELQEANGRLERLAVTDGLTGVYNHRRFHESLGGELARCERHKRPLAVLMIDVDFFKKVNDALGHPAGDELLRRLAEVLGKDLRQTDLIARYGGEEFGVLLPETTKGEALQVGERMRAAVEDQLNDSQMRWPVRVTVSIGVATYPDDGRAGEQLLLAADQALYVAKRQGRNRVIGARQVST